MSGMPGSVPVHTLGRWEKGADLLTARFQRCAVKSERLRLFDNRELPHMETDPGQRINFIDKFPEDVQKMREVCDQRWDETLHLLVTGMTTYEAPAPFLKNDGGQLENRRIPDWVPTYSEPDVGKLKNFNPILIFF